MKFSTVGTKVKTQKGEQVWTDNSIRWTGEEARPKNDDDDVEEDEEEEEDGGFDIFKPDPRTTFSFRFDFPSKGEDSIGDDNVVKVDTGDSSSETPIQINLEGYQDESDQIYVSTGLTLWRSAQHLCEYMLDHCDDFHNKYRILELGAGLGLNGILAYQMVYRQQQRQRPPSSSAPYQTHVVLTDGDTNALAKLRKNVESNLPSDSNTTMPSISVEQLLWGEDYANAFLKEKCNDRTFDVLLASDVVYVHDIIEPLWETVRVLLSRPNEGGGVASTAESDAANQPSRDGGVLYFAYCSRRKVPVKIESVLEAAERFGFRYECVDIRDDIYVYEFRWRRDVSQ